MNPELKRLHDLLNQSIDLMDEANRLIEPSGIKPIKQSRKLLGLAIGELLNIRKFVYDKDPELRIANKD